MLWVLYQVLKETYRNRGTLLRAVRFLRRIHVQLSITKKVIGFRLPPGTKVLVTKPVFVNSEIRGGRRRIRRFSLWRKGKIRHTIELRECVGLFSKMELWIDGRRVRFGRRKLSLRRPW